VNRKRIVFAVVAAVLVAAAAPYVRPAIERGWFVYTLWTEPPPAHLPSPIARVSAHAMTNSWGAARSGGRRHEGVDIFAPKETPVLSTTRGVVTRVGTNTLGGLVIWVIGPGLEWHYYANVDSYGAYRPGDVVKAGDVLGYVGRTGNARGTPFHLHYGIYRRGVAENPYPRLAS